MFLLVLSLTPDLRASFCWTRRHVSTDAYAGGKESRVVAAGEAASNKTDIYAAY